MKAKKLTFLERLFARLRPKEEHHRVCCRCHKPIRRHELWEQVRVGWFAPVYTVKHRDCKRPLRDPRETPFQIAQRLTQELPFDGTVWAEHTGGTEPDHEL